MEVRGLDLLMVGGGMVFCKVITHVVFSTAPVYKEMALADAVLDPAKAHVQCFEFALADGSISDAGRSGVISLDGGGRLGVAHFGQGGA